MMVTRKIDIDEIPSLEALIFELEDDTEILLIHEGQTVARLTRPEQTPPPMTQPRILGLHEGQGWISDDFTDELPDTFWLGADE